MGICKEEFQNIPTGISPKENVIAQLEFELAWYNVTVLYISNDATGTSPNNDEYIRIKKVLAFNNL